MAAPALPEGINANDDFIPSWVTDTKVGLFIITVNLTTWALNLGSTYVGDLCSSIIARHVSIAAFVMALLGTIVCGPLETIRRRARYFKDAPNRGIWARLLGRSWNPTHEEIQERQEFRFWAAWGYTLVQGPSFARLVRGFWRQFKGLTAYCTGPLRSKGAIALPMDDSAEDDLDDQTWLSFWYDVLVVLKWSVRVVQCICIGIGIGFGCALESSETVNLIGHICGLTLPIFVQTISVVGQARGRQRWVWSEVLADVE